jgi:hypothetical protein
MRTKMVGFLLSLFLIAACQQKTAPAAWTNYSTTNYKDSQSWKIMADAATILARKVPAILCYHNIKDFRSSWWNDQNLYGKTAKFRRTNEDHSRRWLPQYST